MNTRSLDVICLGRSSVDLYGEQVGRRLEDVRIFARYVGGRPTNIAVAERVSAGCIASSKALLVTGTHFPSRVWRRSAGRCNWAD